MIAERDEHFWENLEGKARRDFWVFIGKGNSDFWGGEIDCELELTILEKVWGMVVVVGVGVVVEM